MRKFEAIDERAAYMDITRHKLKLRLITAYFPHSGYADTHVQQVYNIISTIKREATKSKKHVVLAADFNARAGTATDDDNRHTIGRFGLGPCNARGQWFKNWASAEDLVITNTFFEKPPHHLDTYTAPNKEVKQIDNILVTHKFWKIVHRSTQSRPLRMPEPYIII